MVTKRPIIAGTVPVFEDLCPAGVVPENVPYFNRDLAGSADTKATTNREMLSS